MFFRIFCLFLIIAFHPDITLAQEKQPYYPAKTWEKVRDFSTAGWSPLKLKEARDFAGSLNMGSVVVLYKGNILVEWGDGKMRFPGHSIRKSYMSAMYGTAVAKGLIDLGETIGELKIDDIPPVLSDEEKRATVQMLLQARSGIYHEAAFETKSMAAKRPARHSHAPGTFWYYNNWDFNVLGEIYKLKTGEDIFGSFQKVIANPIGMEDFDPSRDGRYVFDRKKSKFPAYPFSLSTRNMARFGLLMARNGRWNDQQVISEQWVKESTTPYTDNSPRGGYGYLWWVPIDGKSRFRKARLPSDIFSAMGYKGHVISIVPSLDMVLVYNNEDKTGKTSYDDIARLWEMILASKTQ